MAHRGLLKPQQVASRDEAPSCLAEVCAAFSLGAPLAAEFLPDGLMNRNWRVTTSRGVFAVKQIHDGPVDVARRNLTVALALSAAGVAACPPLLAAGDPVVDIGGDSYCAFAWLSGTHIPGIELSADQARQLGVALGEIHQALVGLIPQTLAAPASGPLRSKVTAAVAAATEADRFLAMAASQPGGTSAFDDEVTMWLEQRKRLLDSHADQGPASEQAVGPVGWTHGDVQHRNILWSAGRISAVIDWDKLRVRTYGEEIARTATIQFGGEQGWLDLGKVSAFVAGYRAIVPITADELTDAVHRLWWKRMTDFWQLEFHYDRSNHTCDHLFFSSERFLQWWTARREEVMAAFT